MSLFSRGGFQRTIKQFCDRLGLVIAELDDTHAVLIFTMRSGRDQILYIVPFDSTLEFSVPSAFVVSRLEDFPHELSTNLLRKSSENKIGFWCIEDIGQGEYAYSYMHNAEMQLINEDYFGRILQTLITECENFEQALRQYL